jgi:undecaprenyl pyrophosphate phosphatase UppP
VKKRQKMNISLFLISFTQVVTESLPISSSSHLRLVGYLLTLLGVPLPAIVRSPQWELFEHLLHIPTVIVVGFVIVRMQRPRNGYPQGYFPALSRDPGDKNQWFFIHSLLPLIIATAVTVACYYIKRSAWYVTAALCNLPTWLGLAITGGVLLATKWIGAKVMGPGSSPGKERTTQTLPGLDPVSSYYGLLLKSTLIGLVQGVALGPGLSRLGTTYGAGVFLGLGNLPALLFSFCLQFILMSGAIVRAVGKLFLLWCGATLHNLEGGEGISLLTASFFSAQNMLALILGGVIAYRLLLLVVRLVPRNRLWPLSIYLFALSGIWVMLNLP